MRLCFEAVLVTCEAVLVTWSVLVISCSLDILPDVLLTLMAAAGLYPHTPGL